MTRQKNKKCSRLLTLIVNRRVDDAIAFNIIFHTFNHYLKLKPMSKLERFFNWSITIVTALLALLNYLLAHLPKTSVFLLLITLPLSAQLTTRNYIFLKAQVNATVIVHKGVKSAYSLKDIKTNDTLTIGSVDSSLYFGPSLSFELYSHELSSGITSFGVMPGIGYGLKWNPYKWKFTYLLGIDLFTSAGIYKPDNNDPASFFNVQIVPVFTFLGYIHIGYGYRWKLGLNGNHNENTFVLVTGASLPLP